MIDLEGIYQTYPGPQGPVEALRGIDLRVAAGEPLALIHAADAGAADRAIASYLAACTLGDVDVAATPMVMAEVG